MNSCTDGYAASVTGGLGVVVDIRGLAVGVRKGRAARAGPRAGRDRDFATSPTAALPACAEGSRCHTA
jgi:hypothetical protein